MPYIAIIHVPDHTADGVAETMEAATHPFGYRVVGLFKYPTKAEIGCQGCVDNGKSQWVRDRIGFMKCNICGLRNKRIRQFLINAFFDFLGANLYEKAPASFQTPEGYGDSPR